MVRTSNIKNGKVDTNNVRYVTEEVYERWVRRGKPKKDDIIITREAPVGEVGRVTTDENIFLGQRTMMYRANQSKIHPHFLFYSFLTSDLQHQMESTGIGSVVAHIRVPDAKKFIIKYPPLQEQKAIASVLSSLDDKIDLLHRQNKTLEQMAETLFRQWFVEEAKEDWEETTLYESVELVGGGTPKTSIDEYWNGDIKWLSGGDIAANHKSIIISTEKTISKEGLNNSSAKLLPKFSTVISARGTVGKYCILSEPMAFSQSNYGIKPKIKECYFFTYLLINHCVKELNSAAYGSVFDTITTSTFKGLEVKIPITNEILEFEKRVSPHFMKLLNNQKQIQTLENLRDTLLPRLMNGEVRVEDTQLNHA